ncbi:MAG: hypothetical protein GY832_21985 [Chloroflexi bacterium]|nr:hypothetical protein [Chloroflexota bacterium]
MGLVQSSAPATEPVTLAEVRSWLRIDGTNAEPAPSALTAALAGAGAGNVDDGVHRYRFTFVTADGETEGGVVSAALTVADKTTNGKASLTAIAVGGSAVTARKVYRTEAGASTYKLLATIADNTTTTYTDNIADAALGAGAPTTNTTDDPVLNLLIKSARQFGEAVTRRQFITATWVLTCDSWPTFVNTAGSNETGFECPRPNLLAVTTLKYYDVDNAQQTLGAANYDVDTASLPGVVRPARDVSWPTLGTQPSGTVELTFTAGYGAAASDVPDALKLALLLCIGHLYEHREAVVLGTISKEIDMGARNFFSTQAVLEAH